ncbi:MAG: leucyl aminopeptidase [Oscillospiraceae bacterium]|nr:leucyl aminopeptidase [Oscillospiraceae bacterium]
MSLIFEKEDTAWGHCPALLCPVLSGKAFGPEGALEACAAAQDAGVFCGGEREVFSLSALKDGKIVSFVLMGLGDSPSLWSVQETYGKAAGEARRLGAEDVWAELPASFAPEQAAAACEALLLADYSFCKYKSGGKASSRRYHLPGRWEQACRETEVLAGAVCMARDMVNEPSNVMTPARLAEYAAEAARRGGFEAEILRRDEIRAEGLEAFLSVARGSAREPRLILLRYRGNPEGEVLALVGKGITYDSGGYSLKPSDSMVTMQSDMAGAAAVIAAVTAAAHLKLKINLTAVVAACENTVSGEAYHPGDIIPSLSGRYIEVGNTDAEGRLTLADAVTWAVRREHAARVVDIATLTGAAITALGHGIIAAMADDEDLWSRAERAAERSCEKIWRLPCDEELARQNKSETAHIKNLGGKGAGTITAGLFIREFADKAPWMHLDIAGPSWNSKAGALCPAGGTGCGVRLLYRLAQGFEAQ